MLQAGNIIYLSSNKDYKTYIVVLWTEKKYLNLVRIQSPQKSIIVSNNKEYERKPRFKIYYDRKMKRYHKKLKEAVW